MIMRCDFRTERECGCPAEACAVQPVTPAPVVTFSWRDHLAAIVFGLVMAGLAVGTMHALNHMEKQYQMDARI